MSDAHTRAHKRHAEAMAHANRGFTLRHQQDQEGATAAFREALDLEKRAAMALLDALDLEPSRSILFRSAASLALLADDRDEARRLAHQGLAGSPPPSIRREILDILSQCPEVTMDRPSSPWPLASITAELRRLVAPREPEPIDARWGEAA